MKLNLKASVTLALILSLTETACSKNIENDATNQSESNKTLSIIFSAENGWDIYKAGIYRYGPSIIINSDNSIDAWFSAPGDVYNTKLYTDGDEIKRISVALKENNTVAQKFTTTTPFYGIGVPCPTWATSVNNITLSLYKWNTDYSTTILGTPIATKQFVNFKDNTTLTLTNGKMFSADDYLWVFSKPSGTVGVWQYSVGKDNEKNFINGTECIGAYRAFLFQTPGSDIGVTSFWDQIAYKRSTDGGITWTKEQIVLTPTQGTRDQLSICDPGVCCWGGYYYLGYTSTEDPNGKTNHVYVARSLTPVGPWQKWSENGWGGAPQPVITYTGSSDYFGAGEPCMVVKDNILFLYYTWKEGNTTTRVATADATDSNWPAHLSLHGTAINKTSIAGSDHCDIKYRDDLKKFVAIHTAARFTENSYIVVWESSDGLYFKKVGEVRNNLQPYLNNCGWSGDAKGHIDVLKQNFVSYAYGPTWGIWNTFWSPISF